ncbi:MAG: hypothetical protein Q9170_008167 [Blastenia crenularia]
MPTDAAVAKFLYTIMKQLVLKSIDWNAVATELQITNGHAARMRYSRFKQCMEGSTPTTRKPRIPAPRKRKDKSDDGTKAAKKRKKDGMTGTEEEKSKEREATTASEPNLSAAKAEHVVEPELPIKSESAIKVNLDVKQETEAPAMASIPVAFQTTITEWVPMVHSPEPLRDFFSTEEELRANAMIDPALLASAAKD